MKIGSIDLDREVLLVAEIGNNHEGNPELGRRMIGAAAKAGAQAVKFQTFRTELFVSRSQTARFERLKRFELTPAQFTDLARTARDEGVMFLSTPLDLESAAFLDTLVPAFKVASSDNTFYPLLDFLVTTGKPVIISTGLLDLSGVKMVKAHVEAGWNRLGLAPGLALLHCACSYPVPPSQANLRAVSAMIAELGGTIGYSDHTLGTTAALVAVALGARLIEKHFTLDRNFSEFRDHQLSADPSMLAALASAIKETSELVGDGVKRVQDCEKPLVKDVRRSITARRDLERGAVLTPADLMWTRPSGGLRPGQEAQLLGRRLREGVAMGSPLSPDLLED